MLHSKFAGAMVKGMNPVRVELQQRLNQGLTIRTLADQLGVHPVQLSKVLHGRAEPGPKFLKALGFRRIVSFEPIASLHPKPPKERKSPKTAPKVANVTKNAEPVSDVAQAVLTAERVKVAVAHGLNPGKCWAQFLADPQLWIGSLDDGWMIWCDLHGKEPPASEDRPFAAPIGQGAAVILKAPNPDRIDRRPPLVISERAGSMQTANFSATAALQRFPEASAPDPGSLSIAEVTGRA